MLEIYNFIFLNNVLSCSQKNGIVTLHYKGGVLVQWLGAQTSPPWAPLFEMFFGKVIGYKIHI